MPARRCIPLGMSGRDRWTEIVIQTTCTCYLFLRQLRYKACQNRWQGVGCINSSVQLIFGTVWVSRRITGNPDGQLETKDRYLAADSFQLTSVFPAAQSEHRLKISSVMRSARNWSQLSFVLYGRLWFQLSSGLQVKRVWTPFKIAGVIEVSWLATLYGRLRF